MGTCTSSKLDRLPEIAKWKNDLHELCTSESPFVTFAHVKNATLRTRLRNESQRATKFREGLAKVLSRDSQANCLDRGPETETVEGSPKKTLSFKIK